MTITINNVNVKTTYGVIPLRGTLDALMKPYSMKKVSAVSSAAVDGDISVSIPAMRKAASRYVSIPFKVNGSSIADLDGKITAFISFLRNGYGNQGINNLKVIELNKTYRLMYDSADRYSNFSDSGCCTLTVKFYEPNPTAH